MGISQETKQNFTSLKQSKHQYCAAKKLEHWFHARPNVTALYEQIQFEIEDLLGSPHHKPLHDLFKEMRTGAKNHLHAATQWMSNMMEHDSQACHLGEDAAWFYVTTAMTGFVKELRKERYCVLDEEVPDLACNVRLGAKVLLSFGKACMCMEEINNALFMAHRNCMVATRQYMNLSLAMKASVEALDFGMEEEFKKLRKQIKRRNELLDYLHLMHNTSTFKQTFMFTCTGSLCHPPNYLHSLSHGSEYVNSTRSDMLEATFRINHESSASLKCGIITFLWPVRWYTTCACGLITSWMLPWEWCNRTACKLLNTDLQGAATANVLLLDLTGTQIKIKWDSCPAKVFLSMGALMPYLWK